MKRNLRLKNFPISFYSVVMGLAGFTIVLQKSDEIISVPEFLIITMFSVAFFLFLTITLSYILKIVYFRKEIVEEFFHPIKINFFPAFSINLLLFSIILLPYSTGFSRYLWFTGTLLHFAFTLTIISAWVQRTNFKTAHMNPAWFIPAVGNMLVPVAGASLGYIEISWFFFSIGLFFWIILISILFYRIFFHEPLPEKLLPTLFILIAPPSVASIAYYKLTGEYDNLSTILYDFALFLAVLLLFQLKLFTKIKYYLSWWAYTFPLAALAIATTLVYHQNNKPFYGYLFIFLLLILVLVLMALGYKTISAAIKRQICIEDE